MKKIRARLVATSLLATALGFAPVTVTPAGEVETALACGQDAQPDQAPVGGTCCRQAESICIIGEWALEDRYYKGEGPCPASP